MNLPLALLFSVSCFSFPLSPCSVFLNIFLCSNWMLLVIYLKGEPYNQKKSKTTKVARHNSNISEMWKTGFKTRQNEQRQCVWGPVQYRRHTDLFALVQDIHLTTKKCVCIVKDLKTTNLSIKLDLY